MAVVKRKNSKFWHIVIYKNGKHHWLSSGTDDEIAAKEMELKLLRAVREKKDKKRIHDFIEKVSGENIAPIGVRLDNAWQTCMEEPEQGERSQRTLESKKYNLNKFLAWMKNNHPDVTHVHQVKKEMAYEFAQSLIDSNISGKTYTNIKTNLHSIFKVLKFKAELDSNVWDFAPTIAKRGDSYRPFSAEELEKILAATAGTEWHGACLLALYTGLRLSDVAPMKWDAFDFENNVLKLVPTKTARFNKVVIIPLHKRLLSHLETMDRGGDYLFPGILREYKTRHSSFPQYLDKAEIENRENVTFHSFRHTFNSQLEELNIDVGTRQKLTGHTTVSMNLIYSHAVEPLRRAIEKLK